MKKWQYQTVSIPDSAPNVDTVLNQHGEQGWEVVSDAVDTGVGLSYLMKREVGETKLLCTYEDKWTDEFGYMPVCIFHGQNSRHGVQDSDVDHPDCLAIDPYPEARDG